MLTAYQLANKKAAKEMAHWNALMEYKSSKYINPLQMAVDRAREELKMVDSRAKGQRAEYKVRDMFRDATGLPWERVPGSGGFGKQHKMKGDIYVPEVNTIHCIEIKSYADDVINSNLLNDTVSQLEKFWAQTLREADEVSKEPILIFKKDRGKWLLATKEFEILDEVSYTLVFNSMSQPSMYICLLEEWLKIKRKYVK